MHPRRNAAVIATSRRAKTGKVIIVIVVNRRGGGKRREFPPKRATYLRMALCLRHQSCSSGPCAPSRGSGAACSWAGCCSFRGVTPQPSLPPDGQKLHAACYPTSQGGTKGKNRFPPAPSTYLLWAPMSSGTPCGYPRSIGSELPSLLSIHGVTPQSALPPGDRKPVM